MRPVHASILFAVTSVGCRPREPAGLDEAAVEAAAKAPDAPPVTGRFFGAEQKRCNEGDAQGCHALGAAFLSGSAETQKDEARATRLFWKACAGNEALSCALLGHSFRDGTGGTKPDVTVAKKYYAKACSLGHQASCPRATSKNGF